MPNPNTNCLKDMRCPECGSYGPFHIVCSCLGEVHDGGVCEGVGWEWDDHNSCTCRMCLHDGTVESFKDPDPEGD